MAAVTFVLVRRFTGVASARVPVPLVRTTATIARNAVGMLVIWRSTMRADRQGLLHFQHEPSTASQRGMTILTKYDKHNLTIRDL